MIKNRDDLPIADISAQMREMRPLPMGRVEFEEWSNRIISGALVPGLEPLDAKFALADMITHLGPTESHKQDAYFIHYLRKVACNQVAVEIKKEIYLQKHPEKVAELEAAQAVAQAKAEKTLERVGSFGN